MNGKLFLIVLALFVLASPLAAQTQGNTTNWAAVASPFAMAIASAVCGLAQGKAVAGACEALARNPGAAAGIRFLALLGLILIESLALYTLVIIFTR